MSETRYYKVAGHLFSVTVDGCLLDGTAAENLDKNAAEPQGDFFAKYMDNYEPFFIPCSTSDVIPGSTSDVIPGPDPESRWRLKAAMTNNDIARPGCRGQCVLAICIAARRLRLYRRNPSRGRGPDHHLRAQVGGGVGL